MVSPKKITKELKEQMEELRRKGLPYKEIMKRLDVSKWACLNYLKDIKIEKSWVEEEWRVVEKEATSVLTNKGFSNIINLNELANSPYWDYYCEKGGKRYLIDVTINGKKDFIDKGTRLIDGYIGIILLKKDDRWTFFEVGLRKL